MTVVTWMPRSTDVPLPESRRPGALCDHEGMRGGRPAGGSRATRCGSPCRVATGGVPGERSARTSSAPSTAAIPA